MKRSLFPSLTIDVPEPSSAACPIALDGTFRDFHAPQLHCRSSLRAAAAAGRGRSASANDLALLGNSLGAGGPPPSPLSERTQSVPAPPPAASPARAWQGWDLWSADSPAAGMLAASPSLRQLLGSQVGLDTLGVGGEEAAVRAAGFDLGLEELQVLGVLGRGAAGTVYRTVHVPSGRAFALKCVPLDVRVQIRRRLLAELRCLLAALNGSAIVPIHAAFYADGCFSFLLSYMDRGSLAQLLSVSRRLPTAALRVVAARLLTALAYLHAQRIVHRDVKPGNVLLGADGSVCLADFGVAGQLAKGNGAECSRFVGTAGYMSPERIAGLRYSYNSDCWSLGLTLLEAATGIFPFGAAGGDFWELHSAITEGPLPRLPPAQQAPQAARGGPLRCDPGGDLEGHTDLDAFIAACLVREASSRPTAAALKEHHWFCPPPESPGAAAVAAAAAAAAHAAAEAAAAAAAAAAAEAEAAAARAMAPAGAEEAMEESWEPDCWARAQGGARSEPPGTPVAVRRAEAAAEAAKAAEAAAVEAKESGCAFFAGEGGRLIIAELLAAELPDTPPYFTE